MSRNRHKVVNATDTDTDTDIDIDTDTDTELKIDTQITHRIRTVVCSILLNLQFLF